MSYLDKIVGQIADEIDRLGLSDNTIIIFTGDNGTDRRLTSRYRDRMVPGGKATMTDTGVRVPFIVRQTGRVKARSRSSSLVDFSDILPTFCEIAGAPVPSNAHGRSFYKLLDNPSLRHREWIYYEYLKRKAVRTNRATLVTGGKARLNADLGVKTKPASADDQRLLEGIMKQCTAASLRLRHRAHSGR